MATSSPFPNFDLFLNQVWGSGDSMVGPFPGAYSNLFGGTNPNYTVTDFYAFYPQFGGAALPLLGALTPGSTLVSCSATGNAASGQFVSGTGIPSGDYIVSVVPNVSITLNAPVTGSGEQSVSVYTTPSPPAVIAAAYIAAANASLMQARWTDLWPLAMGLYAAHFCTLYLRASGNPMAPPGTAALAGLKQGIIASVSAGGVSESLQVSPGLEAWGAWNQTQWGAQLVTFAKIVGMGPMYVP